MPPHSKFAASACAGQPGITALDTAHAACRKQITLHRASCAVHAGAQQKRVPGFRPMPVATREISAHKATGNSCVRLVLLAVLLPGSCCPLPEGLACRRAAGAARGQGVVVAHGTLRASSCAGARVKATDQHHCSRCVRLTHMRMHAQGSASGCLPLLLSLTKTMSLRNSSRSHDRGTRPSSRLLRHTGAIRPAQHSAPLPGPHNLEKEVDPSPCSCIRLHEAPACATTGRAKSGRDTERTLTRMLKPYTAGGQRKHVQLPVSTHGAPATTLAR